MAYKILVLDDEAHYADMLRDLLVQSNFIADMVNSVPQALGALDTEEYALIIADFKMPGMDGGEFLQRVRLRNATIPFFMVSGLMNTHELIRVANLGVTLVFEKPLVIQDFIACVKRYVSPLNEAEFQRKFRGDLTGETYPAELIHLSDKSPLARDFIRRLWGAFRRDRIAITPMMPGAELELVARELSHWKGRAKAEFYTLTPDIIADPASVDALNAVAHDPAASTVLIINGIESASDAHLATLAEFIRGRHTMPLVHRDLFFLIVPDATANGAQLRKRNPALASLLKSKQIPLPPLKERPSDIANLLRNHFSDRTNSPTLTPESIGLLLQHPWPGEYAEFMAILRQLSTMPRGAPVELRELATLLSDKMHLPEQGFTLGDRLRTAQEEVLRPTLEQNGGDRIDALLSLGVPQDIAESLRPGELAYPELLK